MCENEFGTMKYKVAQIIPYFGRWPEWMELYLYSCGKNPMVDFIFYTDCPLPKRTYPNTLFQTCTREEYYRMVSDRLQVDFRPQEAYKLTDLKPFLGKVHEEELRDYEFWGFGDLDLVYGDLGMLVNESNLTRYDVLTTHAYRVAGHFTLLRNTAYYRNLCFRIRDWKQRLTDEKHYALDEMDFSNLQNPYQRNIGRLYRYILRFLGFSSDTVFDLLNRLLLPHKWIREMHTTPNPAPRRGIKPCWQYDVKRGVVTSDTGMELPYLHFFCFKKNRWTVDDTWCWRDGYYQLDDAIERYRTILIDCQSISGTK